MRLIDLSVNSLYFQPSFIYGICFMGILYSLLLMFWNGLYFCLNGLQIHAFHVVYILLVFLLFYQRYRKEDLISRFYMGLSAVFIVWFVHDGLACLSVFTQYGIIRFGNVNILQSFGDILGLYVRDICLVIIGIVGLRNRIHLSFKGIGLLLLQIGLWVYASFYVGNPYVFDVPTMILDFIPYFYLL